MGDLRKSPSVTLQNVLEGVEREFDPFHVQKVPYHLEEYSILSVKLVVEEEWDAEGRYPKWEKIDYILRLEDFIETLGYAVKQDQWIRPPK